MRHIFDILLHATSIRLRIWSSSVVSNFRRKKRMGSLAIYSFSSYLRTLSRRQSPVHRPEHTPPCLRVLTDFELFILPRKCRIGLLGCWKYLDVSEL